MSMIDLPILCILEHSVITITVMHPLVGIASNQQELLISYNDVPGFNTLVQWNSSKTQEFRLSPIKQTT